MIIPQALKKGDLVRVIAPSFSLSIIDPGVCSIANQNLQNLGVLVSFGKYAANKHFQNTATIQQRIEDLHEAFADPHVKAIFTAIGGYHCNQLLSHIDYCLIRQNPKIFCGYSDITALAHALYTKAQLMTYIGPHYSTLGIKNHLEYDLLFLEKALFSHQDYSLFASQFYSDDEWYRDQDNRDLIPNHDGNCILQVGKAQGTLVGGSLSTLCLLQGSPYFPQVSNIVLFVEITSLEKQATLDGFLRRLQGLMLTKLQIVALVIGRFQKQSCINIDILKQGLQNLDLPKQIPIIANANFGHCQPLATYPIGAQVTIQAQCFDQPAHICIHRC